MGSSRTWRLSLIAGAALVAAGLAVGVRSVPGAKGEAPSPPRSLLTVHGPNDGEPLNNSIDLELEVTLQDGWPQAGTRVLVYQGNRYLFALPVLSQRKDGMPGGVERMTVPIDSTYFPNGPLSFSFYLFDDSLKYLLGAAWWTSLVANPSLEMGAESREELRPFRLRGRPGDVGFQLEVGRDLSELKRPPVPGESHPPRRVVLLAAGGLTQPAPTAPGGDSGIETSGEGGPGGVAEIILNVDSLAQIHTLDAHLILWTHDPDRKWAHSKPLSLLSISTTSLRPAAPTPTRPTTYRR